ncbi:MAG TPA: hypothetical protein VIT88_07110 [Pyrinomonadaceae bacterium]
MFRAIVIQISVLAIALFASGQQPDPTSEPHAAWGVAEVGYGRPQAPPVVYGKPYTVPKLRLRITDERTGAPIAEREVVVRYVWRWFEYPYPERLLGVWSDAFDLVKCRTDKHGVVSTSEFKVVPSGWYKGRMLMGRKPEFTHLDVSVHLEKHITHVRVTKEELERYEAGQTDVIPLRVPLISPLTQ